MKPGNLTCLWLFCLLTAIGQMDCHAQHSGDSLFANIDGIRINYVIRGNGPMMIVGHPTSGKAAYLLSLKPLEENFTVVYYDPRGTGNSSVPMEDAHYHDRFLVDEIEGLRKHLGREAIWLFGHSDQSALALQYALKYPNQTQGLILTGTGYVGSWEEMLAARQTAEQNRIAESQWFSQVVKDWDYLIKHNTTKDPKGRDLTYSALKWWCYDEGSSQKVIPFYDAVLRAGKRRPAKNGSGIPVAEQARLRIADYTKIEKGFKDIRTRILIINGKFDTNNPFDKVSKLHALVGSDMVILEKSGHFAWIEQPEEFFNAVNQWIANHQK